MKRIIALILCMILAVSSINVTFAEDASNSYEVERSLGILNAIGRFMEYDMTTIDQTKKVTRGEFSEELAGLLKLEVTGNKLYYHDVSKEYFAYKGITALTESGFVSGCGNGLYEPDRIMTKNEAATVLIAALGYKKQAMVYGGDEFAFMRIAVKLGLFDGTVSESDLTFGDMLVMFVNAMVTPVLEAKVYGETVVYAENQNETLLSIYYDSRYVKNQRVTYANNIGIYGEANSPDYVKIGNTNYISIYKNMEMYLGSYVNFIYKDNPDAKVNEIFWIENSGMYDEIVMKGDEIGKFNSSDYTYSYYTETGRERSVSLKRNISVIYNGRFEANSQEYLKKPCDEIRFIANKDGKYDVAIISSYENYVIDAVYGVDQVFTVRDKFDKISIDPEDYNKILVLDAQGKVLSTDDLASDLTVSVFKSSDNKYLKMIISTETAEGTIGTIKKSTSGLTKLTVEDVEYEVSKELNTDGIRAGDTVFVYLDFSGRIAYIKEDYTSVYLAYITDFTSDGLFEVESKMKALNQDGAFKVYDISNKVKIDGRAFSNPSSSELDEMENQIVNQLAILEFDKDGKVRSIDTTAGEGVLKFEFEIEPDETGKKKEYVSCAYRSAYPKFGKLSLIDNSTKIFSIPKDPQTADDEAFRVMNKSQLKDWTTFAEARTYKYSDATEYAQAVVIRGHDWFKSVSTDAAFVYESEYQTMNSEGDVVNVLCGFVGGEEKEYFCEVGFDTSALTPGCGVSLDLNSKGEVRKRETELEPKFSREMSGFSDNDNISTSNTRTVVGFVSKKKGTVISVGYTDPTRVDEKFECSGTPVLVVDETKNDVVVIGSAADIVSYEETKGQPGYSKVVIQTVGMAQKMIVVYK